MQIILEVNGLWETIEPLETTQSDNKKDKTAIAFFYQALPEEQLLQITKHKMAKAIWDALKTRHIGEQRVQQARLQTLKSDFEMLHMKEDETIDTLTRKLTTLVNKAASLGHTIKDQTIVRKLLNAVPDRYLQIVALMEQYSDLSKMTMEEAIGRLKTYGERIRVYVVDIIINGTPKKEIDKFKAQMEEKFKMSDLGLLAYYLGIEVTQTGSDISIKQSAYANKILKEARMIDCNETLIPMDPGTRLTKNTKGTLEQHMKAIRQILRYIKRTKDYGITYKHNGGNKIQGFSNSSYEVNTQEGKGTTGIIIYCGESPISFEPHLSQFRATFIIDLGNLLLSITFTSRHRIYMRVAKTYDCRLHRMQFFRNGQYSYYSASVGATNGGMIALAGASVVAAAFYPYLNMAEGGHGLEVYFFRQECPLMVQGSIDELIDPLLGSCYSAHEHFCMMQAASLCIRRDSYLRPHMPQETYGYLYVPSSALAGQQVIRVTATIYPILRDEVPTKRLMPQHESTPPSKKGKVNDTPKEPNNKKKKDKASEDTTNKQKSI
nr:zinc finger, CCHC-type [Tanacetum cinerariifolium]